jgi:hypothetical protein
MEENVKPKIKSKLLAPVAFLVWIIGWSLYWIGSEHGRRTLFELAGLCCVGGAVFLELLVFGLIESKGYFVGMEHDPWILGVELASAFVAAGYFFYLFVRIIRKAVETAESARYEGPTKRHPTNRE